MILLLLKRIYEFIWPVDTDRSHINEYNVNQCHPINLHTALINAAEKSFRVGHQGLANVKDAFEYNFKSEYMAYLNHSFQYYYALLFKRALIDAKQRIQDKGIDFDAKLDECNEKTKALCDEILFNMKSMHESFDWIVRGADCKTKTNFMCIVEKIIYGQHKFLQSLNNNEPANQEQIRSYITGLTEELGTVGNYDSFYPKRLLTKFRTFESDANEKFEPIEASIFLDKLEIEKVRICCDKN